jgi:hypothetical protein
VVCQVFLGGWRKPFFLLFFFFFFFFIVIDQVN